MSEKIYIMVTALSYQNVVSFGSVAINTQNFDIKKKTFRFFAKKLIKYLLGHPREFEISNIVKIYFLSEHRDCTPNYVKIYVS